MGVGLDRDAAGAESLEDPAREGTLRGRDTRRDGARRLLEQMREQQRQQQQQQAALQQTGVHVL